MSGDEFLDCGPISVIKHEPINGLLFEHLITGPQLAVGRLLQNDSFARTINRSTLRREVLLEMKVDRVRANHSLRLTASQGTPNIPFHWFQLFGSYRQAQKKRMKKTWR